MKQKFPRIALLLCLTAAILLLPLQSLATVTAQTAAVISPAKGSMPQTLRILLTRPAAATQAELELGGTYTLDMGGVTMLFPRGSAVSVLLIDGRLYVEYAGMRIGSSDALTLTRCQTADGGENGFRFSGASALYEGDLTLSVSGGALRLVLAIDVETYLLGVVPYEMSDSFPLEALKAQAVAARTYAVRKSLTTAARDYNLTDTTNDQVYKGRSYDNTRAEEAVKATAGVCAFDKGNLVMCYYGSSNGGQTELVENQWGAGDETGYLDMRDDLYDLENPKSVVKSVSLAKSASAAEQTSAGLRALIAKTLQFTLQAKGYDASAESVRIDTITAAMVDTPMYAAPSRVYTMFHLTFTYSSRTRTDSGVMVTNTGSAAVSDAIEVSLFTAPPNPADTATPEPTATPAPTPTPKPVYGAFEPQGEVTLDIPIFPDMEDALGLSINQYDNELWTVTEEANAFVVEARRFGHGVGMSQYGAEWMAAQYTFPYTQILAFYYPGVTLMRYAVPVLALPSVDGVFTRKADPTPSPTPRPTLMPQTETAQAGQWYAIVENIGEDSWLNLRAEPNLASDILLLLYKGQRLLVLESMPQEGWVHVKTDVAEGYVMEEFLVKE